MSERERAVLAFLDGRDDELVAFARELVATGSENPPGDERAVAGVVEGQLALLGLAPATRLAAREERPNLIVRVPGSGGGRTLILGGHLDTKPAGDLAAWKHPPLGGVIEDGELHGLGSGDMKGAVAAMLYAAAALAGAEPLPGDLAVVLTADEEAGSALGSRWLAESRHVTGDAAILGEPCGIEREWESIGVVSRGAALFRLLVTGTQMHSSISDRLPAVNATAAMARLIDRMHRELKARLTYHGHPRGGLGPTVNVGVMAKAGVYYGVYPGAAEFGCDVRTLPGMTQEQFEADVRAFLDEARADDPELDVEVVFETWMPPSEIAPDDPVVLALAAAAGEVLGEQPPLDAFPGATDAPFFQLTAGIPTVAAFGPGFLPRAHAPNESVSLAGIRQAARIYALTACRYLDAGPGGPA